MALERYVQELSLEGDGRLVAQCIVSLGVCKGCVSDKNLPHLPVFAFLLILLISWIKIIAIST